MMLFFIGILEMVIVTVWTKTVATTQVLASGVITIINIFIWYYVLQTVVDNIHNWQLVALYAFGCAIGTALTTWFFGVREKAAATATKSAN